MLGRLAPTDGLEIHLGQLVGGWVVYLDRASGPVRAPMHNRVGLRAPAHLTGCGKAALALLPPAEVAARVEAVCAAESRQLPDLAALARELDAARRAGFVVSDTFQPGRTSVAAPVPDPAGAPAGGISVAGPTSLVTGARLERIRDQVVAAAARSDGAWRSRLGADRGALVGGGTGSEDPVLGDAGAVEAVQGRRQQVRRSPVAGAAPPASPGYTWEAPVELGAGQLGCGRGHVTALPVPTGARESNTTMLSSGRGGQVAGVGRLRGGDPVEVAEPPAAAKNTGDTRRPAAEAAPSDDVSKMARDRVQVGLVVDPGILRSGGDLAHRHSPSR